jgi:hypothetical protein
LGFLWVSSPTAFSERQQTFLGTVVVGTSYPR